MLQRTVHSSDEKATSFDERQEYIYIYIINGTGLFCLDQRTATASVPALRFCEPHCPDALKGVDGTSVVDGSAEERRDGGGKPHYFPHTETQYWTVPPYKVRCEPPLKTQLTFVNIPLPLRIYWICRSILAMLCHIVEGLGLGFGFDPLLFEIYCRIDLIGWFQYSITMTAVRVFCTLAATLVAGTQAWENGHDATVSTVPCPYLADASIPLRLLRFPYASNP